MVVGALLRGEEPDGPRKKELSKNKKIYSVVSTLDERVANGNYLKYLEGLTHSIRY